MAVAPFSGATGEYGWRFESGGDANERERNDLPEGRQQLSQQPRAGWWLNVDDRPMSVRENREIP
jgi:hypothetical protein